MTTHLIKIQIFTHASRVTKFSCENGVMTRSSITCRYICVLTGVDTTPGTNKLGA